MRYFNTYGPVNEIEHYVVPRSKLVAELVAQIEQGKYFTIYAPRQMGKTTLLRSLRDVLLTKENYLPVTLSFGGMENWPLNDFLQAFSTRLSRRIVEVLQANSSPALKKVNQLVESSLPTSFYTLQKFFDDLHQLLPQYHIVQIIDEIDGMPQSVISDLLQTWREIYLDSAPPRLIHSVILIGLQNIATLNLGHSSPFHIARELQLPTFTLEQTRFLLDQYPPESAQPFAEGVIEEIHRLTDGHPFLVNRLAAILFGQRFTFTLNTPWINDGVIRKNEQGFCQIANPIYERVLKDDFCPSQSPMQAAILVRSYDLEQLRVGNELQMKAILSRFRQFVERRGRQAFKVTPRPQEATGQYLLMAYLELVVRTLGGDLCTEVDSGEGRLDLIITHQGKRYIIEAKVWRGQSYFDEGLPQLAQDLESEGESEGYLVVFHARPQAYGKLTYDQLEFTLEYDGTDGKLPPKTIHVYLVRLGPLFKNK